MTDSEQLRRKAEVTGAVSFVMQLLWVLVIVAPISTGVSWLWALALFVTTALASEWESRKEHQWSLYSEAVTREMWKNQEQQDVK